MKTFIISITVSLLTFTSCKKEDSATLVMPPVVVIYSATNQTDSTCEFYGSVELEGTNPVLLKGFCWNIDSFPTISNFKSENGSGLDVFDTTAYLLTPQTKYYVRAYATTSSGTHYSSATLGFSTLP